MYTASTMEQSFPLNSGFRYGHRDGLHAVDTTVKRTALHYAALYVSPSCVRLLLEVHSFTWAYGGSVCYVLFALENDFSIRCCDEDELLIPVSSCTTQAGADPHQRDATGSTPLCLCVMSYDSDAAVQCTTQLLEAGAQLDVTAVVRAV